VESALMMPCRSFHIRVNIILREREREDELRVAKETPLPGNILWALCVSDLTDLKASHLSSN
jgi:hypothetical protein